VRSSAAGWKISTGLMAGVFAWW